MIERYKALVLEQGGKIHRIEDWGRRQPAYLDRQAREGSLCSHEHRMHERTLAEIENGFRFNDAILRHLTVKMKKAENRPLRHDEVGGKGRSPQGCRC